MAEKNLKTNVPDSDDSARNKHGFEQEDLDASEATDLLDGAVTSNKAGKHSTVEKLSASRPEGGEGRGAQPVDGAFGKPETEDTEPKTTGRTKTTGA